MVCTPPLLPSSVTCSLVLVVLVICSTKTESSFGLLCSCSHFNKRIIEVNFVVDGYYRKGSVIVGMIYVHYRGTILAL